MSNETTKEVAIISKRVVDIANKCNNCENISELKFMCVELLSRFNNILKLLIRE